MSNGELHIILFDPWIGYMYGPDFLKLYVVLIVAAIIFARKGYALFEKGREQISIIPVQPDPYEIAYLRKGPREVIRLSVYSLLCRGYLISGTDSEGQPVYLSRSPRHPRPSLLKPFEKEVFDAVTDNSRTGHIVNSMELEGMVEAVCYRYRLRLEQEGYLFTEEFRKNWDTKINWICFVVVALGCYKLASAIYQDKSNVMILIVMTSVSWVMIIAQSGRARLTSAGKKYIKQLQAAFNVEPNRVSDSTDLNHRIILGGIIGLHVLSYTQHGYVHRQGIPERSNDSSGGCTGGSSCSGGSCGSGCGGCGGD